MKGEINPVMQKAAHHSIFPILLLAAALASGVEASLGGLIGRSRLFVRHRGRRRPLFLTSIMLAPFHSFVLRASALVYSSIISPVPKAQELIPLGEWRTAKQSGSYALESGE